jgi:hypothetical protein
MKAMPVGVSSPEATRRTPRFVTVIEGPALGAATGMEALTVLFEGSKSLLVVLAVVMVEKVPGASGAIWKSIVSLWPGGRGLSAQK